MISHISRCSKSRCTVFKLVIRERKNHSIILGSKNPKVELIVAMLGPLVYVLLMATLMVELMLLFLKIPFQENSQCFSLCHCVP